MDDLEISEIILGIKNDSMKEHRIQLIEILINKIAEIHSENNLNHNNVQQEQCNEIFVMICMNLKTNNPTIIDLLLSLFINVTITEEYASYFFQFLNTNDPITNNLVEHNDNSYHSLFLSYIEKFLNYNPQAESIVDNWNIEDPWQNLGNVICNLCQVQEGRTLLLKQSNKYMERLVTQVMLVIILNLIIISYVISYYIY